MAIRHAKDIVYNIKGEDYRELRTYNHSFVFPPDHTCSLAGDGNNERRNLRR